MIEEKILGNPPAKSNQYKIGKLGMYKSKAVVEYEKTFFIQCKSRNIMIEGFFELELKAFFPSMASDLDNCMKIILDCLAKCRVIKNDNRAIRIVAEKFVDKHNPRIEFTIKPIP